MSVEHDFYLNHFQTDSQHMNMMGALLCMLNRISNFIQFQFDSILQVHTFMFTCTCSIKIEKGFEGWVKLKIVLS